MQSNPKMEEYLQCVKALHSQMNDVEGQAAKASMEEHALVSTIGAMEKDLNYAKAEKQQLNEDLEKTSRTEAQIYSQILEQQKKFASLELDSSTLTQTWGIIQQERVCLSAKFSEMSTYYSGVIDDINSELRQQEDWVKIHRTGQEDRKHVMVTNEQEEAMAKLELAKRKLNETTQMKCKLLMGNAKMKESIEQMTCGVNERKLELMKMDMKSLDEEYKSFLSDKAGKLEYLQSLEQRMKKLKDDSHTVNCICGSEYKIALTFCA